jgi:two-component system, cell cycle response regulator CpdR
MNAPPRVLLIADDDPAICMIVARVATQLGLTPLSVHDGTHAVAEAQAHAGTLAGAVLDGTMPGMSGIDAASAIHQWLPNLPITLMSGSLLPSLLARSAQLPLHAIMPKPFTLAELQSVLAPLAQHNKHRKPLKRELLSSATEYHTVSRGNIDRGQQRTYAE